MEVTITIPEKPEIIQSFSLRSKTNEGFAAKIYGAVYKDGTIILLKRVVTRIENSEGWELVKKYSNYSVYQTMFSIRTQSLMSIAEFVDALIPKMDLKEIE